MTYTDYGASLPSCFHSSLHEFVLRAICVPRELASNAHFDVWWNQSEHRVWDELVRQDEVRMLRECIVRRHSK